MRGNPGKEKNMLNLDRRALLAGIAGTLALGPAAFAQINRQELESPGQLGEKVLGPADAKVTIVEYASMSCPHCAHFDETTFDQFKLKYIDSGKVRYIFREFPLNAPAFAAAMVARCAPADKFFDIVHTYFRSQAQWLGGGDLKAAMFQIAQPFGFTNQTFDACIANQALFKGINDVRDRGSKFGVQATPTFFINGQKYEGALTLDELDKAITPLLQ
jgi:protein-disulfide isomerase